MTEKSRLYGKKILIVDDEPDVLETLEELLSMCELHRAASFDEAKKLMTSGDLDMAVKRNLLAVMLTAHALTVEDTVKSYKKGAAFFVPKERMTEIEPVLDDVLAAREKGQNHWYNWLDRMGDYYEKRFGPNWKDSHKDFWEALDKHDWRLASRLRD